MKLFVFPAVQGDALALDASAPGAPFRAIIDAGPAAAQTDVLRNIDRVFQSNPLDLVVCTHIDTDHIDGVITMLLIEDRPEIRELWFNSYEHAVKPTRPLIKGMLGGAEGEILRWLLDRSELPWNERFGQRAVCFDPGARRLPRIEWDHVAITVCSPDLDGLARLAARWAQDVANELERCNIDPVPDPHELTTDEIRAVFLQRRIRLQPAVDPELVAWLGRDSSPTNGSSIAMLVEADGASFLLTGDAWRAVLIKAIDRLRDERGLGDDPLPLTALKLSHHGSAGNVNRELLNRLDCQHFLVSTDGTSHGHPDREALDEITAHSHDVHRRAPHFWFNYRSATTEPWYHDHHTDPVHQGGWISHYPDDPAAGIAVDSTELATMPTTRWPIDDE